MSPLVKANTESSDANRELILSVIEGQVEQSRQNIKSMRKIANAVTEMVDEMEQQQLDIEQRLTQMASVLEEKASTAFRQRASRALQAGAARLRNLINQIG